VKKVTAEPGRFFFLFQKTTTFTRSLKFVFMKKLSSLISIIFLCSLAVNAQGVFQLWGMTQSGGADNIGTMFSVSTTGDNFQQRYQFKTGTPGANPQFSEPIEYNGKFYGMTPAGGSSGLGVIFEWDPVTNVYTKKIDFNGNNGSRPQGSLVLNGNKFYGMTVNGGISDLGVIFEWDPATNIYTKRMDMNASGGRNPLGNLVLSNGKFYGMTIGGGTSTDFGVIFEWDPVTNVYTKKIDFNFTNGGTPLGSLSLSAGKFYGMTLQGGSNNRGVIFEWDPVTNVYIKRIDFNGTNGGSPLANNLVLNSGKFYGMTASGGSNNIGVIFEWNPATNVFTKKIDLDFLAGNGPGGSLRLSGGKFYGLTSVGGTNGAGVIFEWNPVTNVYLKKIDLSNNDGGYPQGSLAFSGGKFYGMTGSGGSNGAGVIFIWDPTTNVYTKRIDLNTVTGNYPLGKLTANAGKYYGMVSAGGNSDEGIIFEFDPSTNVYTKKFDFTIANGSSPFGSLSLSAGKLYGMTNQGGANSGGVIFEWDPATSTYTKKFDFNLADGILPFGNLIMSGGKFYGMTGAGGSSNDGVIFEWDPVSNVYTKKVDLNAANGRYPFGDLILNGGKFYGMTSEGGTNGLGVIFEWDPSTNTYTKKIDLDIANGNSPFASMTLSSGKFYGMTRLGGSNNAGVIFEWDPATNVYTKKIDLTATTGSKPITSLTLSGGKFYGMTYEGGANNLGVVFEWDPATNVYTKKKDFTGTDGANASYGNDFTPVPVPVAKGLPGNCVSFPAITIDNSNNNIWVPIVDNLGDVVAEIKANGNNLGIVNSSMYVHNAAVREDGNKRLYLDRNLTITPQVQPVSLVDIRLYLKGTEYTALKNAVNSISQSSGISSINDVGIFKNNNSCLAAVDFLPTAVTATAASWEADYVLSASISSFSSFYFANKAFGTLPVTLLEFNGQIINSNSVLNWKTDNEQDVADFEIERSTDGRRYTMVGNVAAVNQPGVHQYNYTDNTISALGVPVIYYRLKQKDIDGRFTYSSIVALSVGKSKNALFVYPNPVSDKANFTISLNKPEKVEGRIIDITGRIIHQQQWTLLPGSTSLCIDIKDLVKGIYYLELKGETINERKQFVK
jgi:uncharacterized repeat protein (TIGR03803 family)